MDHCENRYQEWGYKNLIFSLSTNGSLLHKPKQLALLKKYSSYMHLGVSIDGDKEKHDRHRLTVGGKGSFDDVQKGMVAAMTYVNRNRLSVKATFTKDTISEFARSIKYLFSEYGNNVYTITANFNFEERFDVYDSALIANEQFEVIKYIQSNDFFAEYTFISNKDGNKQSINLFPPYRKEIVTPKEHNHCGSCTHMRSLGYNNEVYGCNRFSTMKRDAVALGKIEDGKFIDYENPLIEKVSNAYKEVPPWCQSCRFNNVCSDCVAVAVDEGINFHDYYRQNRMCGFTKASALTRLYNALLDTARRNPK